MSTLSQTSTLIHSHLGSHMCKYAHSQSPSWVHKIKMRVFFSPRRADLTQHPWAREDALVSKRFCQPAALLQDIHISREPVCLGLSQGSGQRRREGTRFGRTILFPLPPHLPPSRCPEIPTAMPLSRSQWELPFLSLENPHPPGQCHSHQRYFTGCLHKLWAPLSSPGFTAASPAAKQCTDGSPLGG